MLSALVGKCPTGDFLDVLGDFNAETLRDRAGNELCLGLHSFEAQNVISQFLLEFLLV